MTSPLPADEAKARFDELRRVLAATPKPAPLVESKASPRARADG